MRSSRKNLKLRHGSVNVVRQRFEIFPITTELSRLLCCLLYGLQTEEMKNLFKGKSLVYVRRCQFQSSIPTFLLCLRLIDMFSACWNICTCDIRPEIVRVISKSNERAAWIWLKNTSVISDQNCAEQSSVTTLLHLFWNRKIKSLRCWIC